MASILKQVIMFTAIAAASKLISRKVTIHAKNSAITTCACLVAITNFNQGLNSKDHLNVKKTIPLYTSQETSGKVSMFSHA